MAQPQDDRLHLLLDVPEKPGDVHFGFDAYASTLASAIIGTEPHFTIGIYGGWGQGKTTLLGKVQSELEVHAKDDILTVPFDAWRYQREEHMLLPLLETVREHLDKRGGVWKDAGEILNRVTKSFVRAITIMPIPQVGIDASKAIDAWEEAREARSAYYGWLTELQEMVAKFRENAPQRRIVVLIDDLDRCLPHKAVDVLEAVKVMLDVDGFVFILAVSEEVISKAVENQYEVKGEDYLKKVIQVPFRLPPLRRRDIEEYARTLQNKLSSREKDVAEVIAQVAPLVGGLNPREVKRFINYALLSTDVARRSGLRVPLKRQTAFWALAFAWPPFVEALSHSQDILDVVRDYMQHKPTGESEETKMALAVLQWYPGLESFLEDDPGKQILQATTDELDQLVYYSSLVRPSPPPLPMRFYGKLLADGKPAVSETEVIVVTNGEKRGSTRSPEDGLYILLVQRVEEGTLIEFYANGIKCNETARFAKGKVMELDLTYTLRSLGEPV